MQNKHKVLMLIEEEIDKLCKSEAEGLTTHGQYQLHLLLENKKDLCRMYGAGNLDSMSNKYHFGGEPEYGV